MEPTTEPAAAEAAPESVGCLVQFPLPTAAKVHAVLALYEDAAGKYIGTIRQQPESAGCLPIQDCLDLLCEALISAIKKHTEERVVEMLVGMLLPIGKES